MPLVLVREMPLLNCDSVRNNYSRLKGTLVYLHPLSLDLLFNSISWALRQRVFSLRAIDAKEKFTMCSWYLFFFFLAEMCVSLFINNHEDHRFHRQTTFLLPCWIGMDNILMLHHFSTRFEVAWEMYRVLSLQVHALHPVYNSRNVYIFLLAGVKILGP